MARSRTYALLGAMLVLTITLGACGSDESSTPPAETGGAAVAVTLGSASDEYELTPNPAETAAGSVAFRVVNGGKIEHEMVVIATDKGAANLGADGEADETGAVGELTLATGESGDLTLDLPAGKYALVCNLPGHYAAGMFSDFTVT